MKLSTVQAIVERDRALEVLRSRHPVLAQVAALHAAASHSVHPWPATQSVSAFDHWVLGELRSMGPAAVERQVLARLLGMMQATAFEHLQAITRGSAHYAALLLQLSPRERVNRGYPTSAELEQQLLDVARAFQRADALLARSPAAGEARWTDLERLAPRLERLRELRGRMESVARYLPRRTAALRERWLARGLGAVALLSTAAALGLLLRLGLPH